MSDSLTRMLLPCPLTPLATEVWELRDELPGNPFEMYDIRQLIAPDAQEPAEVALGLLTVFADMRAEDLAVMQADWLDSGMHEMVPTLGGFLGLRAQIFAMRVTGQADDDLTPLRDYIRNFNRLCVMRWTSEDRADDARVVAAWLEDFDTHWAQFLDAYHAMQG